MSTSLGYEIQRFAAFAESARAGGNPAGVLVSARLPATETMQSLAAEVGFSETVFAAPSGKGWLTRYFSPVSEIPFCGHATIALGAALAIREGNGTFDLSLRDACITVKGMVDGEVIVASLQSPPTRHSRASRLELAEVLRLFGYTHDDLDPQIPPAHIHGGVDHFVLSLRSREKLSAMRYDQDAGRRLMDGFGWVTIILVCPESPVLFHTRNPFASGGVYEDPATGAAAAALTGYLRDMDLLQGGRLEIVQGEDMGMKSRIIAETPPQLGASVRVSGLARPLS